MQREPTRTKERGREKMNSNHGAYVGFEFTDKRTAERNVRQAADERDLSKGEELVFGI